MKSESKQPIIFNSISALHSALGLPKPLHPLISLVNYGDVKGDTAQIGKGMVLNFYKISFKKKFNGQIRYGQNYYDFDEGGLSFFLPNQVITAMDGEADYRGYTLLMHPDFITGFPLGQNIKNYGFFAYSVTEALCLSDEEKKVITSLFENIATELDSAIDQISQEVLLSQIELLLNYSKRYYSRQFITRKTGSNDLLVRFEALLTEYFDTDQSSITGLPTVVQLAEPLNVSPHYLSDMLRTITGQNTQQHIHQKLIEKAKKLLSTSSLTISEIAYKLGFEHPQSFNRTFKKKTQVSPLEFRNHLTKTFRMPSYKK